MPTGAASLADGEEAGGRRAAPAIIMAAGPVVAGRGEGGGWGEGAQRGTGVDVRQRGEPPGRGGEATCPPRSSPPPPPPVSRWWWWSPCDDVLLSDSKSSSESRSESCSSASTASGVASSTFSSGQTGFSRSSATFCKDRGGGGLFESSSGGSILFSGTELEELVKQVTLSCEAGLTRLNEWRLELARRLSFL